MKKCIGDTRSKSRAGVAVASIAMAVSMFNAPGIADEADAKKIFQSMSDYLVAQKSISFSYDATLEIVTDELQKLGFASSGQVTLNRPDKLRMSRTGGMVDMEFAYDGKSLAIMGKNLNVFTKIAVSGSVDDLLDTLRFDYDVEAPAADLLSDNPNEIMMSNVTDVKDLGSGIIGGKECDHLAFRTRSTDWQIWIAHGDTPYPCRFTITSKLVAQAPSYTIEVREWKTGDSVMSDDFQLKTGDAKQIKITEFSGLSEIPADSE